MESISKKCFYTRVELNVSKSIELQYKLIKELFSIDLPEILYPVHIGELLLNCSIFEVCLPKKIGRKVFG
jgi:hypothetical protein